MPPGATVDYEPVNVSYDGTSPAGSRSVFGPDKLPGNYKLPFGKITAMRWVRKVCEGYPYIEAMREVLAKNRSQSYSPEWCVKRIMNVPLVRLWLEDAFLARGRVDHAAWVACWGVFPALEKGISAGASSRDLRRGEFALITLKAILKLVPDPPKPIKIVPVRESARRPAVHQTMNRRVDLPSVDDLE